MSDQSRIEPCRADHMPVIEYRSGVSRLLLAATKASEKSWVKSARSMREGRQDGARKDPERKRACVPE